jgi:hypothetical protein
VYQHLARKPYPFEGRAFLFHKPLIKVHHWQRQHLPRRRRVVERNAHLVKLPSVAQLVLFAHAEACVAVEGCGTGFADEGAALYFSSAIKLV